MNYQTQLYFIGVILGIFTGWCLRMLWDVIQK